MLIDRIKVPVTACLDESGNMVNHIDAGRRCAQRRATIKIAKGQFHAQRAQRRYAGIGPNQAADSIAAGDECFHQMQTDKTGPARY